MSIVGPRPVVSNELDKYGNSVSKVLSIKPGITGLWQVSGRNNLTYKKEFFRLPYVDNINFLIDVRIIIRTFGVIFFRAIEEDIKNLNRFSTGHLKNKIKLLCFYIYMYSNTISLVLRLLKILSKKKERKNY